MLYIVTLLFINCLLFQSLQGMDTGIDPRKDMAPKATELLKKLGSAFSLWEDRKQIIRTLIQKYYVHPDDIRYECRYKLTALHDAIDNEDYTLVRILIAMGADLHSRATEITAENCPPLFFACTTKMAQLLLDNKASVNEKGETDDRLPLLCHIARRRQNVPALIAFYAQHKIDVCAVDRGHRSPLDTVVLYPHSIADKIAIAQKLIEIGVPIHTKVKDESYAYAGMSVMQVLKVRIKKNNDIIDTLYEREQLLAAMKTTIEARVFKDVHNVLTKDTTGIVVSYYGDAGFDTE